MKISHVVSLIVFCVMSIDNALAEDYKDVSYKRTSVHDPSVVIDTITNEETCTYYIFGSHMAVSKSTDLVNWIYVTGESTSSKLFGKMNGDVVQTCSYDEAYLDNVVKKVKNYKGEEVDFGTYNIPEWQGAVNNFTIRGNQWAPDVVYNKTMKKWLMYMSLNGDDWNSAIVCLASDNIEGPYVYQGPVIFSGFTGKKTSSHQDFHKSDLEIAIGEQSALPSRYNRNSSWGTYLPHAIDPCVFYDEEGNLKLSYGSWSGGIYLIDLDENTGLRDYTVNYAAVNAGTADVTSDPYFGKKIAGGWYVSGEGSYIEHIGKYYYLFMSYGFYSPDGGYEMRVFRAENPEGPYVDTKGTNAIFFGKYEMNYGTSASGTTGNRGVKLMGNYKWDTMPVAEISQGHNSAMTDKDGRSFVIYHTKFNDGTDGHSVRVHQLFQNEDGWLVASPY
ncbi:MAG: family 43 glycosylhydrolase, partial [Bacteroidaceae bacterium]|nr:family 43 glycosylhydrolase [Bacteroidaceae bacterium]